MIYRNALFLVKQIKLSLIMKKPQLYYHFYSISKSYNTKNLAKFKVNPGLWVIKSTTVHT